MENTTREINYSNIILNRRKFKKKYREAEGFQKKKRTKRIKWSEGRKKTHTVKEQKPIRNYYQGKIKCFVIL